MERRFDVVFALTGDVRCNSRALKQLRLLSEMGLKVRVLCFGPPASERRIDVPGISLEVLERPAGSGPGFFFKVARQFRQEAVKHRAKVFHASDLYVLPAMSHAANEFSGALVFDSRELYTHVTSTTDRPWVRWVWHLVQRRFIGRAAAVFTVSDPIADRLVQDYGITRPVILHNVPPRQKVHPGRSLRSIVGASERTAVLLHQGSIQKNRGCQLLIDAMRDVRGGILVFLGGGPLKPAMRAYAQTAGLNRVHFLDAVPPDELLPLTATADAGITLLEDTCLNHRYALPNKLFEYAMAGLPVIASDLPEISRVVESFKIGRVVNPADSEALADTLQYVIDHVDERQAWASCTPQVLEVYNWESAARRFTAAYRTLIA